MYMMYYCSFDFNNNHGCIHHSFTNCKSLLCFVDKTQQLVTSPQQQYPHVSFCESQQKKRRSTMYLMNLLTSYFIDEHVQVQSDYDSSPTTTNLQCVVLYLWKNYSRITLLLCSFPPTLPSSMITTIRVVEELLPKHHHNKVHSFNIIVLF